MPDLCLLEPCGQLEVKHSLCEEHVREQYPDELIGFRRPRHHTEPLRPLNRSTSRGFEVIDFADSIGEPLLPWQRFAVVHAMELLPDGTYRFRTVLIIVARQNGKSSLKRIVSLWRLYMDGAKLVVGAAQDVTQALEQMNGCLDSIRADPDLNSELASTSRTTGRENFKLASGGRYLVKASNDKAGRGLAGADEVNIDELRVQANWKAWASLSKITAANINGQNWCMSNAGDDNSVVLNQLREVALGGTDPSMCILEWSAPDNCELDDEQAWCQANPGLGYIMSPQYIQSSMKTDPPAIFRTEVLCQRVNQLEGAIDIVAWQACCDPQGDMSGMRDRLAACFDIAPDGLHASLAVAAKMPDGRFRVEMAGAWPTVEAAWEGLPLLLDKIAPLSVAWYPSGPGAGFSPMLRQRKEPIELGGMKAAEACMGLADLIRARQLVQPGDPLLDQHIAGSEKLPTADGWRFTRRGEGHVDAAYAAAGAVQAARIIPEAVRPRLRVVTW